MDYYDKIRKEWLKKKQEDLKFSGRKEETDLFLIGLMMIALLIITLAL